MPSGNRAAPLIGLEVEMSMQKSLLFGAIFAALTLCIPAHTQPPPQTPMNPAARPNPNDPTQPQMNTAPISPDSPQTGIRPDDRKFLKDAAIGGMTEVELGKLAQEKGSSDSVKQFGQKMIDDHTKANDQLRQVAVSKSISIPESLDAKHKSRVDKLSKLSGAEFDKAYIKDQLKDHEQDVKEFQEEAQGGADPAVKDFAAKTLPTLQSHLQSVKDLEKGEKSTSKSTSSSADRSSKQ
jgi:putative membrane protein